MKKPITFNVGRDFVCFFSKKDAGDLHPKNLVNVKNLKNFKHWFLPPEAKLIVANTCHGSEVAEVGMQSDDVINNVDSLVTTEENIILGVPFADCSPVLIWDEVSGMVGAAHSGVKSTMKKIVVNLVKKMGKMGAKIENLGAVIGPGICGECYEYGPEAENEFIEYCECIQKFGLDRSKVNISGIIARQLAEVGMKKEAILFSGICTFEDKSFFSARREKFLPGEIKACLALIGRPKY